MRTQKVTFDDNELPVIINKKTGVMTVLNEKGEKIAIIPNIDPEIRKEYIKTLLSNYNLYTKPTVIQTI